MPQKIFRKPDLLFFRGWSVSLGHSAHELIPRPDDKISPTRSREKETVAVDERAPAPAHGHRSGRADRL